jgi:hypothetical protein
VSAAAASGVGVVVVVVVVVIVEAGVGGGTGDVGRRCVLGLSDGMLDEPGSGYFVDCELACAVIIEQINNGMRNAWSSEDTHVWRDPRRP